MGYRTVVMLNNDCHNEWSKDPNIGNKISIGMSGDRFSDLGYGKVVECVHADAVTLARLSFYQGFERLTHCSWTEKEPNLVLLKELANHLGY